MEKRREPGTEPSLPGSALALSCVTQTLHSIALCLLLPTFIYFALIVFGTVFSHLGNVLVSHRCCNESPQMCQVAHYFTAL